MFKNFAKEDTGVCSSSLKNYESDKIREIEKNEQENKREKQ